MVARNAMAAVFAVILTVLDATLVGKILIVDEVTPPTVFTVGKSAVPPKSFVNLILPFTLAVASGVAVAAIPEATPELNAACTNSVVAICVVFVPSAAVGATGVPVNVGDALFAFKAISAIFAVMLDVLAAMAVVLEVILEVFAAIETVFAVILAVLDVTLVFKVTISFEFVVIFAALMPILFVFVAMFVALVAIAAVFAVILEVLDVTLVSKAAMLFVFEVILDVLDAIFEVLVVTVAGNVEIVDELTPPILLTVGKSAVPPKSFVNFILPFTLAVASGVADAAMPEATPAVNAD